MTDFDDRYLDVYFPADPNYVFGDLGGTLMLDCANYETEEALLTWSEIDAAIELLEANPQAGLDYLVRRIYNQSSEGSCVGNAGTQGIEVVGTKQLGKLLMPELSAISLYKQIGSSPSSGANVGDSMRALQSVGVLPLDTPKNREKFGAHVMPPTGFRTPFPDGWKTTAAYFRGVEFLTIRKVQELFSALCKGHPVIVGREGHSILYLLPMRNRRVKYVNSWKMTWGLPGGTLPGGFGVDSQRQVEKSASWAYAIRSTVIHPKVVELMAA